MSFMFDIKTEHGVDVTPGDYIEAQIFSNGIPLEGSEGKDEYNLHSIILPGKRIAGFGRSKSYTPHNLPAGLSALEADESGIKFDKSILEDIAVKMTTNMILDQGLLAHYLNLHIYDDNGYDLEIPLCCPNIKIDWQSRGTFFIKVGKIL